MNGPVCVHSIAWKSLRRRWLSSFSNSFHSSSSSPTLFLLFFFFEFIISLCPLPIIYLLSLSPARLKRVHAALAISLSLSLLRARGASQCIKYRRAIEKERRGSTEHTRNNIRSPRSVGRYKRRRRRPRQTSKQRQVCGCQLIDILSTHEHNRSTFLYSLHTHSRCILTSLQ